jgi:hypothetical protein
MKKAVKKVAPKKAPVKAKPVVKEVLTPKPVSKPPVHIRTMPAGNFDEVSRLLTEARKSHDAARVYARGEARPIGFKAHWQTAYEARKKAHEFDPEHIAPAWKAEQMLTPNGKDTHEQFMKFYEAVGCV